MDLSLDADHRELRTMAKRVFADHGGLALARAALDGRAEHGPLLSTVAELGWFTIGLGDDPFGLPGLACLAECAGRVAATVPLVDAVIATGLAAAFAHEASSTTPDPLVAALAEGGPVATVALLEQGAQWTAPSLAEGSIRRTSEGYRVTVRKLAVSHARGAGVLCVVGRNGAEPVVAFVSSSAAGVRIGAVAGIDASAQAADIEFAEVLVPHAAVFTGAACHAALERAELVAAIGTAAEELGAAAALLELAVEHAKLREQFGRPVGSFQALAHLLADAHARREAAWSTTLYAAVALDERTADATRAAHAAKIVADAVAREVVETGLQTLGGIAFTWEHDAHLLQRRVLACAARFGDTVQHERQLADLLLGTPA